MIDSPTRAVVSVPPPPRRGDPWGDFRGGLGKLLGTMEGRLAIACLVGLTLMFWPLLAMLSSIWGSPDGYYSHGILIPFISGYVVYRWWPRIRHLEVRPGWWALAPMFVLIIAVRAAYVSGTFSVMSFGLVGMILCGVWLVAGARWARAIALPALYLLLALPVFGSAIDVYTNPLQLLSTSTAYHILDLVGRHPIRLDGSTVIYLNHFTLDVAVPCSGLKLVIAISAFTAFFMMIGNLRWYANLAMVAVVLPLCVGINGLRVALIGIVGDSYGDEAGHRFHDYSGWITLVLCFVILFGFARRLGWKD